VERAFDAAGVPGHAQLVIHTGAHEIDLPTLTFFLTGALGAIPRVQ